MKKLLLSTFLVFAFFVSEAQILNRIKNKVEEKVANKAVEALEGKTEKEAKSASTNEDATVEPTAAAGRALPVFDFKAGANVIFEDSFVNDSVGPMPHYWKSSGSGAVVNFPGVDGKWLLLNEFTTYKLDTLISLPENFTIEFDILTRSDQAKDLHAFVFGLAKDNSVAGYEDNISTKTTIHYWNEEIINYSTDTKVYNTIDFDLKSHGNRVMHVSINVQGKLMQVYLDKVKVLDTEMLSPSAARYFYFNPSTRIDNDAQLAVGNFRIAQ
ncbi:hypothetical protein [Albibacterium profundi]|uniref:Uncharacterized protein n=1 Tax=Albibacterium profundi TaxID=3134906 RepID=A0ABV5CAC3_9SPHI